MARLVLTDVSPLIGLARIDGLVWLGELFGVVWMPPEVRRDAVAALDWNGRSISASFGIALYPDDARDSQELIRLADRALYAAKAAGKNRVILAGALPAATPLGDDADAGVGVSGAMGREPL
jgi:hypothetical protein